MSGDVQEKQLGLLPSGAPLATWVTARGISTLAGNLTGALGHLTHTQHVPDLQSADELASDQNGDTALIYESPESQGRTHVMLMDRRDGARFRRAQLVATVPGEGGAAEVAVGTGGSAIAIWESEEVTRSRSEKDGGRLGPSQRVGDEAHGLVLPGGEMLIVYNHEPPIRHEVFRRDVLAVSGRLGGPFGAPVDITPQHLVCELFENSPGPEDIAVSRSGNAIFDVNYNARTYFICYPAVGSAGDA